MKLSATIRVARLFAGIALVAITAAAGQEQAPKADEQSSPLNEIKGTIASLDENCSSFVLRQEAVKSKTETKFSRETGEEPWTRESEGCSFVSLSGNKMVLKAGISVTVRYVVEHDRNIIKWIVVLREPGKFPCLGQGGAERTPDTWYEPDCDGIPAPVCAYCPFAPYDMQARLNRVQGKVILRMVVLPDGTVSEVKVFKSLEKGLDKSALETIRRYRFKPMVGPEGKPVKVALTIEVNFRLR